MALSDILLWIIGSLAIMILLSIFLGRKKPKRVTLTPPLGNIELTPFETKSLEPKAFSTTSFATAPAEPLLLDETFSEFGLHDNLSTVIKTEDTEPTIVAQRAPIEKTQPKPIIKTSVAPRIVSMYVMAMEGKQFFGYELLQALSAAGLVYGKMNIFHRYDDHDPEKLLFSLASATEPGIFDLDNMGVFSCSGVTLFIRVDPERTPEFREYQFSTMLKTAEQLAEDLDGKILNDQREPLSEEKLEEYYQLLGIILA